MSRIPFIEARFFSPEDTSYTLEKRFVQHLRDLRSRKLPDTSAGAEHAELPGAAPPPTPANRKERGLTAVLLFFSSAGKQLPALGISPGSTGSGSLCCGMASGWLRSLLSTGLVN